MSVTNKNTKEDKQLAVSVAVLEVIERDGLLGVTHSKVSRKSKVSRAWIYEYIGKEKGALIEFAAEVFASHFARAKMTDLPKTKAELECRLKEGIDFLFDSVELSPVIIKLYFRFRGTSSPLGQVINKYEKHWLKDASKTLIEVLGMSDEQASILAELILTLRLGFGHRFATSDKPDESRERAKKIFNFIHSLMAGSM
jgi:DNA-binding transcriptional regulator YbjK